MSPEGIDKDLIEILQHRFKNKIGITQRWTKDDDSLAAWRISCLSDKLPFDFVFWLKTRRTMEFRQPHGEMALWAHWVIQNELATKYDGSISNDGLHGAKWGSKPHISHGEWIRSKWRNQPGQEPKYDEARKYFMQKELDEVPEVLRNI